MLFRSWLLEVRRGNTRQRLAAGVSQGAKEIAVGPFENLPIRQGDVVSLIIGPRDGNHACDLTAVDLTLRSGDRSWDLAKDVSSDLLAGNPHADQFGNAQVWHFYTEPVSGTAGHIIPPDSLLAKWQSSSDAQAKQQLAVMIEKLLLSGPAANVDTNTKDSPDAALRRQLTSISGPLFSSWRKQLLAKAPHDAPATPGAGSEKTKPETAQAKVWGIAPERFGRHPDGSAIDPAKRSSRSTNCREDPPPRPAPPGFCAGRRRRIRRDAPQPRLADRRRPFARARLLRLPARADAQH